MDTIMDYVETLDYASLGLVALPIVAIMLSGLLLLRYKKTNTAQQFGNKAGCKSQHKNDAYKNNGQQMYHNNQQQQNNKQRKPRNVGGGMANASNAAAHKRATGNNASYRYEHNYMSACVEDNLGTLHNPAHRNSTSSDDVNSSSSNEDLSFISKSSKKSGRSRQRRQQQKRKQHAAQQANVSIISALDYDEDTKENQRPMPLNKNMHAGNNLRKQCTTTNAQKISVAAHIKHNNSNAAAITATAPNPLCTSASSSSVSSTLSSHSSIASSTANSAHNSPTASPTISKYYTQYNAAKYVFVPTMQHNVATPYLSERELAMNLRQFIVREEDMPLHGYPVESRITEGCVDFFKVDYQKPLHEQPHIVVINAYDGLDAQFARSFCKNLQLSDPLSGDSGRGSSETSPQDSDACENEDAIPFGKLEIPNSYTPYVGRECSRCKATFETSDTGEYLSNEDCYYHSGRLDKLFTSGTSFEERYNCCNAIKGTKGCQHYHLHVWNGSIVGLNGPFNDFRYTQYKYDNAEPFTKVYAIDCEMSFTGLGLEVTKITLVAFDGQVVYDHYVQTRAAVVDYNTRFSGVTASDLDPTVNQTLKTFAQVQHDLLQFIDAQTILVGHGLESDLRALRIVHKTIVDTAVVFQHKYGFPSRHSLRYLTRKVLHRQIQCSNKMGHSSAEDSRAALDLMIWKTQNPHTKIDL